jgi:transcriptional regulator with XRE-family HTH domain
MKTLDDIRKELSPERKKRIQIRTDELITEEMTRQDLRRARQLTQVRLAKKLGMTQDGVSRLEKRSDILISTLSRYIEAMGGKLSLVAKFPDRDPVILSGITGDDAEPGPIRRRKQRRDPA